MADNRHMACAELRDCSINRGQDLLRAPARIRLTRLAERPHSRIPCMRVRKSGVGFYGWADAGEQHGVETLQNDV